MKILYFEDNEQMAVLVGALLKGHGYDVEHFALGKPGLARFCETPQSWDAVIVDLDLPDVPGMALIPEIAERCPTLPIIVYSGMSGMKEHFELYTSGASAVLLKPSQGQDLLDVLKELIKLPPGAID